jgi:DNA-binding transcriptional LysR family regulator
MEIRRLHYFVRTAELGSLCRASDVLRIAQPALTRQVRLLEDELGVKLFTRTRRGMRLTEEGQQLLADVIGPLRQLEAALQHIRSVSSGLSGNVTVGMTPTVACVLAEPLIGRMCMQAPNVAVRIVEGTAIPLAEGLTSGELDVALLYDAPDDPRLTVRELLTEDMVVVGAPDSTLRPDRVVDIEELITFPLILPNPKNGLRSVTERYAARFNVHFHIKHVIDSFPVLKDMVGKGHGYTILPLSSVLREVEAGTLAWSPVRNPSRRTLVLATRAHARGPRVMARLEQVVEDVLWELHQAQRVFGAMRFPPPGQASALKVA